MAAARILYRDALGMVETCGLTGSVEALDAMTKAAEVHLSGPRSSMMSEMERGGGT